MWYFAWILGTALACGFGILNAMWFELKSDDDAATMRSLRGQ
jgi:cyd operon protein YbgT